MAARGTAETEAEGRLVASAGRANVMRQHMGSLQHNKTIAVNGPTVKKVVCGSTNLSWRGFFVQANNALVLTGQTAVDLFFAAFDNYFDVPQEQRRCGIRRQAVRRLERSRPSRHRREGGVFAAQRGQCQARRHR